MKKFLVRVNNQEFEVEVEELIQKEATRVRSSQGRAKHQVTQSGNGKVSAPMPGTITQIHVKIGDIVTMDQDVVTLEAMKMENRILAGKDGQILDIKVSIGQSVSSGDLIIIID
ncbi:MAG: acetyl-CoA carboxylase biotin carboxyl carrier protein subunit [Desulfosporosinus sp.]|nr:acetyl-CoA carboxylase biotin carboxyl carrier protein subunit [Desulfosporosinus sp.]